MKRRFIKWIALTAILISTVGLDSCIKSRGGTETDFSNLQDFVIFQNGGLRTFAASSVNAGPSAPDTVRKVAIVTLASTSVASAPLKVTVGVEDSKRTEYNAANGTSFQAPAANMYKIVNPTVTIPAGQNYATVTVEFYARKLDPSISYLLPISILDASGKNLSGNQNTLYYNVIGNPIAGDYELYFTRWLKGDSVGGSATANAYHQDLGTTSFSPINATSVETDGAFGDLVDISFKNTAGVLSNFQAAFPAGTAAALGVTSWGPPLSFFADPAHGYYRLAFQYVNASGTRTVVYEYVKK